jgi:hypothetical protein
MIFYNKKNKKIIENEIGTENKVERRGGPVKKGEKQGNERQG